MNGDGNQDLLVNSGMQGFLIFLGKGDGTFNNPVAVLDRRTDDILDRQILSPRT